MKRVTEKLNSSGPDVFYEHEFRVVIEEHLSVLKKSENGRWIKIAPHLSHKYSNDLYGLLCELEYPREYHWIIMRANELHTPASFSRYTTDIFLPSVSEIENLRKISKTRNRTV